MSDARELLSWYDRHARDLPWRRDQDPYRVWISEIMLQQTRVDTVLPYYDRFLERFPTVEDLAAAPIDEVLALWSGLGYYRRARQMHAAAQSVVAEGEFPSSLEGLRSLPGIGEYTAAAVGSIAFGIAVPVLDGNVERVTARLLAEGGDPKSKAVRERLWSKAAELLTDGRPGDGNQALMELGATVCTPRRPRCLLCPLQASCAARSTADPEAFPAPKKRRQAILVRRLIAVVESEGRLLLFKRPEDSTLLAGIWELPWVDLTPKARAQKAGKALAERYGGGWEVGEELGRVRHGITHRRIEVEAHAARFLGGSSAGGEVGSGDEVAEGLEAGWFESRQLADLPLSSLVTKVLARVQARD